jgi:hypothetical protein
VRYRKVVMPKSALRTASCNPSADEINALPEKFRQYIHDLVSRCDKIGHVQFSL